MEELSWIQVPSSLDTIPDDYVYVVRKELIAPKRCGVKTPNMRDDIEKCHSPAPDACDIAMCNNLVVAD